MARGNNRGGGNRGNSNRGNGGGGENRTNRNNNPSGRNQYSSGVMDMARERPIAAATAAVGAAAAGLFLWSRRAQISHQLSNLSDQIGEWSESMGSSDSDYSDDTGGFASTGSTGGSASQSSPGGRSGLSETGGGNASLGASSGGGGSTSSASGRGRAKSTPTVEQ